MNGQDGCWTVVPRGSYGETGHVGQVVTVAAADVAPAETRRRRGAERGRPRCLLTDVAEPPETRRRSGARSIPDRGPASTAPSGERRSRSGWTHPVGMEGAQSHQSPAGVDDVVTSSTRRDTESVPEQVTPLPNPSLQPPLVSLSVPLPRHHSAPPPPQIV